MASSRASYRRWLLALTDLPTASGREHAVADWVRQSASRKNFLVSAMRQATFLSAIAVAAVGARSWLLRMWAIRRWSSPV